VTVIVFGPGTFADKNTMQTRVQARDEWRTLKTCESMHGVGSPLRIRQTERETDRQTKIDRQADRMRQT
jgi:hypothetical protein